MDTSQRTMIVLAGAITILLTLGVVASFSHAKSRPGTVVLPGGITYLGPSQTPIPSPNSLNSHTSPTTPISPSDVSWSQFTGSIYPYSFSYPTTLSLGIFPNDPYDPVTIFSDDTNPQENLLLRVENTEEVPVETYARNWFTQYSAWAAVVSVTRFVNKEGLVGWRATYRDTAGNTPYDHVFFEVPDKPELVIWMSGKLLPRDTFDKIVDSVSWEDNL